MPDAGSTAAFSFGPAQASDFERLFDIRLLAMRDSLERIGRFDPDRARKRFNDSFRPGHTRLIFDTGSQLLGCVAFGPHDGALLLEHFYLVPKAQSQGIGGAVLRRLLDEADTSGLAVRLDVLRDSDARRFYARYGFVETHRDAFDIYMERPPFGA